MSAESVSVTEVTISNTGGEPRDLSHTSTKSKTFKNGLSQSGQYLYWTFTDWKLTARPLVGNPLCKFLIFGKETCPDTGRPHWQGYVEFKTKQRLSSVKKLIDKETHWEPRNPGATAEDNIVYCSKGGDFYQHGEYTVSKQGTRTDLDHAAEIIKNGGNLNDVYNVLPSVVMRYHRGLEKMISLTDENTTPQTREVVVEVHWGVSGSGKTHNALLCQSEPVFAATDSDNFGFEGYRGEKIILFDEFDSNIKLRELLRICDKYKYRCNVKGSSILAQWTKVIICSNIDPAKWYPNSALEKKIPLLRRIGRNIKHYTEVMAPNYHLDERVLEAWKRVDAEGPLSHLFTDVQE